MRSPDSGDRLTYARSVLAGLYPDCDIASSPAGGGQHSERSFAIIPSPSRPRLLVPAGSPATARAALRAYGGRLNARARLGYRCLVAAAGLPGSALLRPDIAVIAPGDTYSSGIDGHLTRVLGQPVTAAIHLTPARANRKAIVQALTVRGRYPIGFAKVAQSDLSVGLIANEARALRQLAGADSRLLITPTVIDNSDFAGRGSLVLSPLPTWSRGRLPSASDLAQASAELVATATVETTPLAASSFWMGLREGAEGVADADRRDPLRAALDAVTDCAGNIDVTFGASHGDWSPWNMWRTEAGLLVWDWERFRTDAPVGSDLTHYRLQELLIIRRMAPLAAARAVVAEAASPSVAALHLLALAVRYDVDDQAGAGSRLHPTRTWLLPAALDTIRAKRGVRQ